VGLLDTLFGRTKPVRPNLDSLFALPSAAITLQSAAGLVSSGRAGICWKPPAGQPAEDVQHEIGELLTGSFTHAEDSYGYRWLLVEDPELEDLVNRVHLVNTTLTEAGWGPQLLCSVFGFSPGPDAAEDAKPFFLVYLYKRGTFYPFAPDGAEHRDTELELRLRAIFGADLPIEPDLSRWFPLWDLPLRSG